MKKVIAAVLTLGFVFCFAACNVDSSPVADFSKGKWQDQEITFEQVPTTIEDNGVGQIVENDPVFQSPALLSTQCDLYHANRFGGTFCLKVQSQEEMDELKIALPVLSKLNDKFDFGKSSLIIYNSFMGSSTPEITFLGQQEQDDILTLLFYTQNSNGMVVDADIVMRLFAFSVSNTSMATQCTVKRLDRYGTEFVASSSYIDIQEYSLWWAWL